MICSYLEKKPDEDKLASPVWRQLFLESQEIRQNWAVAGKGKFQDIPDQEYIDLGNLVFTTLKSPQLTCPPLIREDPHLHLQSTFQEYLAEFMYRQQDIEEGVEPLTQFTFLSQ